MKDVHIIKGKLVIIQLRLYENSLRLFNLRILETLVSLSCMTWEKTFFVIVIKITLTTIGSVFMNGGIDGYNDDDDHKNRLYK